MTKSTFPFSERERREIFENAAHKLHMQPAMVEKDFWVYGVLSRVFGDEELSQILCFKGGTSLSKVFRAIERFSEDIDLILSEKIVLREGETLEQASKSGPERFNKAIEDRAGNYIVTVLKGMIKNVLDGLLEIYTDEEYASVEPGYNPENFDKHLLHVVYPRSTEGKYLSPAIKLEIGPLALWNPNERYPILPYVAETYPDLDIEPVMVPTIKSERTFWEKVTILHHEHYRPPTSPLPLRYARHYYDVFKLGHSAVKGRALANFDLLREVVAFKERFYPRKWARYDEACKGTLRLYPAEHNLSTLKTDYDAMQGMIFGEVPNWRDILVYLQALEEEINR